MVEETKAAKLAKFINKYSRLMMGIMLLVTFLVIIAFSLLEQFGVIKSNNDAYTLCSKIRKGDAIDKVLKMDRGEAKYFSMNKNTHIVYQNIKDTEYRCLIGARDMKVYATEKKSQVVKIPDSNTADKEKPGIRIFDAIFWPPIIILLSYFIVYKILPILQVPSRIINKFTDKLFDLLSPKHEKKKDDERYKKEPIYAALVTFFILLEFGSQMNEVPQVLNGKFEYVYAGLFTLISYLIFEDKKVLNKFFNKINFLKK